jgi:all-trans-nonaprenyl-diphosphate synthase
MTTTTAFASIEADLQRVREGLQRIGEGDNPLLVQTIRHLFGTRGKYIRPALCLMVGRLYRPVADERLIDFAAAMEVVHSASLVHDDTLDEAATRRGRTTVNAGWNGHIAILVGDYLFAQSAIVTAGLGELRVMSMLAATIKSLVRGELRQMETAFDWGQTEQDYLDKIGNKTASLLALCTEGAGVLSGAREVGLDALHRYGYNLGLAFQIVDDVLDLTESDEALGKPAGSDLAQGTLTLPVIYYLETASPQERALVVDGNRVGEAVKAIAASAALRRARARAEELADEAVAALECLPQSDARRELREMARFAVQRTY